jgi:hypothetical protein
MDMEAYCWSRMVLSSRLEDPDWHEITDAMVATQAG